MEHTDRCASNAFQFQRVRIPECLKTGHFELLKNFAKNIKITKKVLAYFYEWLYIIRACLRQEKGRIVPKTVEKYAFPASKDAESCCAIR